MIEKFDIIWYIQWLVKIRNDLKTINANHQLSQFSQNCLFHLLKGNWDTLQSI